MFFTLVWKLENFSYFWQTSGKTIHIVSQEFHVPSTTMSKWRLFITDERRPDPPERKIPRNKKLIKLYLLRCESEGSRPLKLHIEAELLRVDESLLAERKLGIDCVYPHDGHLCVVYAKVNFDRSIAEILPQDVLIAKCKLWSTDMSFLKQGQGISRTYITVESLDFIALMEGISNFMPGEKREARIKSASVERPVFIMNICLSDKGEIVINVIGRILAHLGFCKVFILDNCGKWEDCGQDSEWRKIRNSCEFPLTLGFNALINKKQKYLQNDMMTLKCEVTFYSTPLTPKRIDEIKYDPVFEKENEPQKSPSILEDDVIA